MVNLVIVVRPWGGALVTDAVEPHDLAPRTSSLLGWSTSKVQGVPPRTSGRVDESTVPRPREDPHGDSAGSPSPHIDAFIPAVEIQAYLFFFMQAAPTEIYTLSLHDALPI